MKKKTKSLAAIAACNEAHQTMVRPKPGTNGKRTTLNVLSHGLISCMLCMLACLLAAWFVGWLVGCLVVWLLCRCFACVWLVSTSVGLPHSTPLFTVRFFLNMCRWVCMCIYGRTWHSVEHNLGFLRSDFVEAKRKL